MKGDDLRRIGDFEALCRYLEDKLGWPLGEYDFDTLTFQYDPDELGLQGEYADAIESIHQLRPVTDGQPWGIFFVRFRKKELPVGVLRRILSQLALRKRASANKAERAAWLVDDLLFVSAFGDEARNREIAFAHFHQHGGDLPTLRVIGWDGNDTPLKLEYLQGVLANKLRWPADPTDAEAWRTLWRSPFRHRPGHVIRKSDELAHELAKLARAIRDRAQAVMKAESAKGPLTKLFDAFKKALIHDLTREGFADTYAQTITYGLLTAAISRTEMSEGRHGTALLASDLADMVPVTNPFLKEMLQTFLEAGGRKGGIDFDELGVQDVVELLRGEDTDLPAILRDFGNRTRGEDPVIHFYEHFLKAYNKQLKVQRGVFYTPQPVVSYIVRSVHELLQSEFGLPYGLADTTTWGEMLQKHPELKLPLLTDSPGETRTISTDEPFVQILDPATGTATFLVEVIDVIHRTLVAKWKAQRLSEAQQRDAWNEYVPKHLLPRLHAYELMMAPYAIAHMKIGLKLAETGYHFRSEERARIYLTNALEPWVRQMPIIGFDALAHEAAAVNEIKRDKRFTVVIGNPPYSVSSRNNSHWIVGLCEKYKEGLHGERNLQPLSDDYVKFLRLAHFEIEQSTAGVIGLITNREYLQGVLHRIVRKCLSDDFSRIDLCDLHGQRGELFATDVGDENVFEIEKGVAIGIYSRLHARQCNVTYGELVGAADSKLARLTSAKPNSISIEPIYPGPPQFFFRPQSQANKDEFHELPSITEFFTRRPVTGFATHRDGFAIGFSKKEVDDRLSRFIDPSISDAAVRSEFQLSDTRDWKLVQARKNARQDRSIGSRVTQCLYRPFDVRWVMYSDDIIEFSRRDAMQHIRRDGIAIICSRIVKDEQYAHVFASHLPVEKIFLSPKSSNNAQVLISSTEPGDGLIGTENCLRVPADVPWANSCSPEALLFYIYAVLHSPMYRTRYAEFLKTDFPRIPLAGTMELLKALSTLGEELVSVHLMESSELEGVITEYFGDRNPEVGKPNWSNGTVWVNRDRTAGFRGVPENIWNFHIGGYQVCEKWLKDRKGRTLSKDDIAHYHKIVVAISETIRLMAKIDRVIDQHGGWPGAFATATDVAGDASGSEPLAQAPRAAAARAPNKRQAIDDMFAGLSPPQAPVKEAAAADEPRADLDDTDAVCAAIRQHLGDSQTRSRDDAITTLARAVGYQRTTSAVRETLDNAIRTAVRRGILQNGSGGLSLRYRTLEQHADDDRDGLKDQFLASLGGRAWAERDDAIKAFSRWLGFRRTGPKIDEVAASLINGLLREGRLEKEGTRIRRAG